MNKIQKKFIKDPRWNKVSDATKAEAILKSVNKDKKARLEKTIKFGKEIIKGDDWEDFKALKDEFKKYDSGTGYKIILEKPRKRTKTERVVKSKIVDYAINVLGYNKEDLYSTSLNDCLSIIIKSAPNRSISKEERELENSEILEKLKKDKEENLDGFIKQITTSKRDLSVIENKIKEQEESRKFWITNILCSFENDLDSLFPSNKIEKELVDELNKLIIEKAELDVKKAIQIRFRKILKDRIESEVKQHALTNKVFDQISDDNPWTKPRVEIRSDKASENIRNLTKVRNKKIEESRKSQFSL